MERRIEKGLEPFVMRLLLITLFVQLTLGAAVYAADEETPGAQFDHGENEGKGTAGDDVDEEKPAPKKAREEASPATTEISAASKTELVTFLRKWFPLSEEHAPIFAEKLTKDEATAATALGTLMGSMKMDFRKALYDKLWAQFPDKKPKEVYERILWAAYKEVKSKHYEDEAKEEKELSKATEAFRTAYDKSREEKRKLSEQYQKLTGELQKATSEQERNRIVGELQKLGFKAPTNLAYANFHGGNESFQEEAARALDASSVVANGRVWLHLQDPAVEGGTYSLGLGAANSADRYKNLKWAVKLLANPGGTMPNEAAGKIPTLWEAKHFSGTPDEKKRQNRWVEMKDNKPRFTTVAPAGAKPTADGKPDAEPTAAKNPGGSKPSSPFIPADVPQQRVKFDAMLTKCNKCHDGAVTRFGTDATKFSIIKKTKGKGTTFSMADVLTAIDDGKMGDLSKALVDEVRAWAKAQE